MAESPSEIKRHYHEDFDPKTYRDFMTELGVTCFQEEYQALEKFWCDSFKGLSGTSLLEIGSGPTVYGVAPACHQFTHIVVSDYIPANVEELKKWVRGDPNALDWTEVLKRSAVAQGFKDPDEAALEIQEKLRRNVKSVIQSDLLSDHVVSEEYRGPYDVVIASLVLEAAAPDLDTYKKIYKKLNGLLKVGGHLLVRGFLMGGKWRVGEQEFPHLKVSEKDVQTALKEAGFVDLNWHTFGKKDMELYYEFTHIYVVRGTKSKECLLE